MHNVKIRFAYKKGFRRAWMAFSLLWMLGIFNRAVNDPGGVRLYDVQMMIILPICLYIFGAICVWIIEGFASFR